MSSTAKDSSDRDTFYVLVTGANSGLGYAICARLISDFLFTRPSNQHLYLIPSTRSQDKADDTVRRLEAHIDSLAAGNANYKAYARSQPTQSIEPPSAEARSLFRSRVTLDPALLDLCRLPTVLAAGQRLSNRIPRLDVLICNAGMGGWLGVNWLGALKQLWNEGIVSVMGRPTFQKCRVGAKNQLQLTGDVGDQGEKDSDEPVLGEVFCANFFGHYVFVHELKRLLSHGLDTAGLQQGRVIWITTNQCERKHLDLDDMQGLRSLQPYESSKRLTDILVLGAHTNQAKSLAQKFFSISAPDSQDEEIGVDKSMIIVSKEDATSSSSSSSGTQSSDAPPAPPPRMLLAHPGICLTSILPLPFFLVWAQLAAFYISRCLGSIWHTVTPHKGAVAPVWLTFVSDEALDEGQIELQKWGSMANWRGTEGVIETEVDDWGIKGEEENGKFASIAEKIWTAMEQLREEWTGRIAQFEARRSNRQ